VWLLDASRQLVPVGTPGEICFGGIVAAGYLAQPDLTAARFVDNPLLEPDSCCARQLRNLGVDGARVVCNDPAVPPSPTVFSTGDMAVRLATGAMRYVGRADRQVKIRGFRVERAYPRLKAACPSPLARAWQTVALLPQRC
jgi:non-ribosomal peptide synthetase component F